MMRDLGRVTRGLAATVLLALLLLGVPVFLAIGVGWPLPRSIPAWGDVTATVAGDLPLDSQAVLKALACVMWVAWAQVVVATVIEAGALTRGRVATPLRGFGHMQQFAGPLLSAVALLLPSGLSIGGIDPAVPSTSDARPLAMASGERAAPTAVPPNLRPIESHEQLASAVLVEHTVVRRDTLWDLAERYMSPGGSIEQISAAVQQLYDLNAGRPQPAGDTLTDASLIRPGWVLQIPMVGTAPSTPANGSVLVQPGDTLWELAEDHLGDGLRYVELHDLNMGQPQPDGVALRYPSLIEPGWILRLPGEDASAAPAPAQVSPAADPGAQAVDPPAEAVEPQPPPTSPPVSPPPGSEVPDLTTTAPQETGPDATEVIPTEDVESGPASPADRIGPLGVAGGVLGLGLIVAAGTRRRRSRMRRQPGSELPALPQEAAALVADLAEEELDRAAATSAALRQLTIAVASLEQVPVPILATVNGDQFELLLDREEPSAPPGWTAGEGGRIWCLDLNSVSPEPEVGPNGLPALASIGRVNDGGLLLNLEALGAISLVGDTAATTGLASSLAIELAISPLAEVQEVHLVGDAFATSLPSEMLGISRHASVAEAIEASKDCGATIGAALAEMGLDSPFALRSRAPEEAWPVAVVIADAGSDNVDDDSLDRLVARCRDQQGLVAVIVGACPAGATAVTVGDGQAHIEELDLHCQLQQLDPSTVAAVESLLAGASAPAEAVEEPATEPVPLSLFEADEPAVGDPEAKTEHEIAPLRLQLLGPLSFEGDVRPQQLALLTYLILHPGATADAIRDAIWGGQAPTRERFLNTIHELRRVVGSHRLPASTDSRYRLQGIACDALVAQRHIEAAAATPECAAAELRAALELVNGPPLTYDSRSRRHFRWVDLGNHANRWERILGDAAHDLASLALAADDAPLAVWAAEQGLLASPGNETLTSDLVSAHVAAGDRRAAETVVDSYEQTLEELGLDEGAEALHDILEPRRAS